VIKLYGAEVTGIGRALPGKLMTNQDMEAVVDTSDEWIQTRTGIKQRYVLEEGESVSDLSVKAGQEAIEQAGISPEEIDLIVTGTFTADYRLPGASCLIQDKLGATRAGAFDLNSACTGFIYSLVTGAQFVKTGAAKNVLVVGADCCSRMLDWEDRSTCVLFGDGASALVLSRTEDSEIGVQSHFTRTDGGGYSTLWIEGGGSNRPIDERVLQERAQFVKMAGKDVFKFAIQAISNASLSVMEQEGLKDEDIKLMVPHQANQRIISAAAKKLGLEKDKVYINIDRYGNTVGASVGLALYDSFHEGLIVPGDKVLVVGFGAGLSWGATVINWSLGK